MGAGFQNLVEGDRRPGFGMKNFKTTPRHSAILEYIYNPSID